MRTNARNSNELCTQSDKLTTVPSSALLLLLFSLATFKAPAVSDADWAGLGSGLGGPVYALAVSGTTLYAGGSFTNAGGVSANFVAKWDGSAWSALGSGVDGPVYALAVDGTGLYAGGAFTNAGGLSANRIAKWNGSSWEAMGLGMDGPVYAVDGSGGSVYAGGSFTTADGVVVNNVARWQGTWTAMRGPPSDCSAPGVYGGSVYAIKGGIVAGPFSGVCGFANMPSIVTWNGSDWWPIDGGLGGSVYAVANAGNYVFFGGNFLETRNSNTLKNIARFDGSSWNGGWYYAPNDSVYALAVSGTNLFMGGAFTTANLMTLNHIAWFNTNLGLSALGSGVNGTVRALAADGAGHLFVGGAFTVAGTNSCSYIAQLNIAKFGFPSITFQPQSSTNGAGTDAHFNVSAAGPPPLGYQWCKGGSVLNDGGNVSGARSSALTVSNVFSADAGGYFVIVTNGYGSVTSQVATLTVLDPFIITQPVSRSTNAGVSVQFNVVAGGTPPFSYEWLKGGATLTNGGNISGAQTATLRLTNVLGFDAGGYSVRVTNAYGSITSQVATLTVGNKWTEADLRAAMAEGGPITFPSDGAITLANTISVTADTVLDGTGHQVTISGGDSTRVFSVTTNVVFTLVNLTIANGRSSGGGIYNSTGTVNATNCNFRDNTALASPGGAAIYNSGILNVSECAFVHNQAIGVAGLAGPDGSPFVPPGSGGTGGPAVGGAIYNAGFAVLDRSLFATNSAVGGLGGHGGNGYIIVVGIYSNQTGGRGGDGGIGQGGALFNVGEVNVINCTFAGNEATGGAGGQGGFGGAFTWNPHGEAQGFPGGQGGGGGIGFSAVGQSSGALFFRNCTVAFNSAIPGAGGAGGSGSFGNPNGQSGPSGQASIGGIGSPAGLINTLLASNSGGNGWSGLTDLGHNLSSDDSCAFTNTGSVNNIDPKVGPLANHGGATLTMALLPGSPAIDGGDTAAAPFTDQRGFPRPAGSAVDIGAFEYGSMLPVLSVTRSGLSQLNILIQGNSNQWCRLLASSNFSDWIPIATNQIGGDGKFAYSENLVLGVGRRFYRVVMP